MQAPAAGGAVAAKQTATLSTSLDQSPHPHSHSPNPTDFPSQNSTTQAPAGAAAGAVAKQTAKNETLADPDVKQTPAAASTPNPTADSTPNPKSMQNSTVPGSEPDPIVAKLSDMEVIYYTKIAENKKWKTGSIVADPPEAQLPYSQSLFCEIHKKLISTVPPDDIYSGNPWRLVANRRFNLPQKKAYLIHSSRHVGAGLSVRGKIANSTAYWKRSGWEPVSGSKPVSGSEVPLPGILFKLTLAFNQKKGEKPLWIAEEYVSVDSKAGNSSVVVLFCNDAEWNNLESMVEDAERTLALRCETLLKKKLKSTPCKNMEEINQMEDGVKYLSAILGLRITEFERGRLRMCEALDSLCGLVGVKNENGPDVDLAGGTGLWLGADVGLDLGLGVGARTGGSDLGLGVGARSGGSDLGSDLGLGVGARTGGSDLGSDLRLGVGSGVNKIVNDVALGLRFGGSDLGAVAGSMIASALGCREPVHEDGSSYVLQLVKRRMKGPGKDHQKLSKMNKKRKN